MNKQQNDKLFEILEKAVIILLWFYMFSSFYYMASPVIFAREAETIEFIGKPIEVIEYYQYEPVNFQEDINFLAYFARKKGKSKIDSVSNKRVYVNLDQLREIAEISDESLEKLKEKSSIQTFQSINHKNYVTYREIMDLLDEKRKFTLGTVVPAYIGEPKKGREIGDLRLGSLSLYVLKDGAFISSTKVEDLGFKVAKHYVVNVDEFYWDINYRDGLKGKEKLVYLYILARFLYRLIITFIMYLILKFAFKIARDM